MEAKVGRERGNKLNEIPLMILGQELDGDKPKAGKCSLHGEDSFLPISIVNGTIVLEASSSQLGGCVLKIG